MNRGSSDRSQRFTKPAREFMERSAVDRWNAVNAVLQGSNNPLHIARAEHSPSQPEEAIVQYGAAERIERRELLRRARPNVRRLTHAVRNAMAQGNQARIRSVAENYFRSFDARFLAASTAREKMKRENRPHIGSIKSVAETINPFALEFEQAKLHWIVRPCEASTAERARRYRPIINFDHRHRTRQQLVLRLLQDCFEGRIRDDQYGVTGRGRDHAVREAIRHMQHPFIDFVAECDVKNFFPTIGERGARHTPAETLQEQLPMIPRAVIESCMLSSGVLVSTPTTQVGLEACDRTHYARTGVPQGSALSSFIAEHIMTDIMANAETLTVLGSLMVTYVDNIAVFGETADDVNSMIEPLAVCAHTNPFGSFDLRRQQTTRHKSEGFIFLGYYLRYHSNGHIEVDVANRNKSCLQENLACALSRCRRSTHARSDSNNTQWRRVGEIYSGWINSFSLVPDIHVLGQTLFEEVVREQPPHIRRLCNGFFESQLVPA